MSDVTLPRSMMVWACRCRSASGEYDSRYIDGPSTLGHEGHTFDVWPKGRRDLAEERHA